MEDVNDGGVIRSWVKSVMTYTGFSFQSLLTRQILSAISGLLVNLLITPLLVRFVDADFRASSLKRVLLLSLVSVLLPFILRYFLIKLKILDWFSSPPGMDMDMDAGGYGDEINSSDYSVFTTFQFPVPDNLLPGPQRLPVAEDTAGAQVESAPVSIRSESLRLSSSLSEPQPPPPPSYKPQRDTSAPTTASSSSQQRFFPFAPPSPMKGKSKLRTSRQTTRIKNMNPKASFLHQSLLHPMNTRQTSKQPPFRKLEADSVIPQKKGLLKNTSHSKDGNTARIASASSAHASSWAWDFMEKASFDQFKRDYANFRSINSSLLGAFATDTLRAEASRWNKGRGESDASQRQKAQVSLGKEDHHQLQKPAPGPPAFLQAVASEVNPGIRKMVERKTKCSGCLKTFMPSFCFQRRKREQRRWNSRRFRQISHAPLLWSPVHHPTTTTITSPPTARCL